MKLNPAEKAWLDIAERNTRAQRTGRGYNLSILTKQQRIQRKNKNKRAKQARKRNRR